MWNWVSVTEPQRWYIKGILPKGPICHAKAWRVGPFWQDTLDINIGLDNGLLVSLGLNELM